MENIRLLQPDIFHTSDLLYDNHMEAAFSDAMKFVYVASERGVT